MEMSVKVLFYAVLLNKKMPQTRNPGRFAPNPVRPVSRFAPIPPRPGSFRPHLLIVLYKIR